MSKPTSAIILATRRGLSALFSFTKYSQSAHSGLARHISRNALNPILFLCLITTPLFFGAAYLFKDDPTVSRWLLIGGAVPMVIGCAAYIGFAIFKPEKLQSESFQLRQQAIQLVAQKGKGFSVPAVSLEAISNPAQGMLGIGDDTDQR